MLALSWPTLRTFLPLGLATSDLHHWTAAYEIAFIGGIFGILAATEPLERMGWLLRDQGSVARIVTETVALTTIAALLGLFALAPAHAFGASQPLTFQVGASFAALVLGWVHVAVVAAAALRWKVDGAVRAACIGLAVAVLPGLLAGPSHFETAALSLLDAGGTLRASFDFTIARAHWITAFAPIVAWGAVAVAFARPTDPPSTATHALRDPR